MGEKSEETGHTHYLHTCNHTQTHRTVFIQTEKGWQPWDAIKVCSHTVLLSSCLQKYQSSLVHEVNIFMYSSPAKPGEHSTVTVNESTVSDEFICYLVPRDQLMRTAFILQHISCSDGIYSCLDKQDQIKSCKVESIQSGSWRVKVWPQTYIYLQTFIHRDTNRQTKTNILANAHMKTDMHKRTQFGHPGWERWKL